MDRGGTWFGTEEPQVRLCEFPGCDEPASHRAPRTPTDLRTYRWFCLGHVRDYNRSWNFFEGWNQGDIERFQRDDMTGHRPTWPFGQKGEHDRDDLEAVFHAFKHEWFGEGPDANGSQRKSANGGSDERRDALALLNLAPPFDLSELKQRYKSLVKQHHPDANGGSRESEELLKRINHAYNYLKKECS
jgi:DnaJ-domain-containing protein 1